jgi:hypothetical protein
MLYFGEFTFLFSHKEKAFSPRAQKLEETN